METVFQRPNDNLWVDVLIGDETRNTEAERQLFDYLDTAHTPERVQTVLDSIKQLEVLADAARQEAQRLRALVNGREDRATFLRDVLCRWMAKHNLKKISGLHDKCGVQTGKPKVVIPNPDLVPDEFCAFKKQPRLSVIGKAIDEGRMFDWCYTDQRPKLRIS